MNAKIGRLYESGGTQEGIDLLSKAIESYPDYADYHYKIALFYDKLVWIYEYIGREHVDTYW